MTHKSNSSDKRKVWINSRFSKFSRKRVQDPQKSPEVLYKEYIMQAKQLCTNQRVHRRKIKKLYQPLFYSSEKEGGFFHPPVLWQTTQLLYLTDLIILITWSDFIKKIKYNKSFCSVGFSSPLLSGRLFWNAGSLILTTFMLVLQLFIWRWLVIGTDSRLSFTFLWSPNHRLISTDGISTACNWGFGNVSSLLD